jgi:Ca2+-binding EF-hand superfamily protein
MKRLCCLVVAGLALAACWTLGSAETRPTSVQAPAEAGDHYDIVYFAESQPVLLRVHVRRDGKPLSVLWDECITKVFKYLDTNGDGFLDKDEVQRVPPPAALFGVGAGEPPTLSELDGNGDGKVSRDELAAYYRRHGATSFQVPGARAGRNQAYEERLALAELELAIVDEELALQGGVGRPQRPAETVNEALFRILDTNGDGKLSKEELLAAPTVLMKLDRNDDEMITPDEILPRLAQGGDGAQLARARISLYRENMLAQRGRSGPFWLVQAGESKRELARQLVQHYGKGGKGGKLTQQDLGLDKASFAKLDVDGNGFLDDEELSRFAQRTPDVEIKVDLGAKPSAEIVKSGGRLESKLRLGQGGVLMLEIGDTRLDLKALASEKVDTAVAAKRLREQYLAEFKRADLDGNGYLDMAEAMRSQLYRNLFKVMDRDGDGKLFEKEVIAYLEAVQDLQAAARLGCASVDLTSEGKGLFELLDADGDGRLSLREMKNAVKLLADLDRDGDGCISRSEIPRCSQAAFRMGPASGGGNDAIWDVSTGKVLAGTSSGGNRNQPPARPARGPEWFRKMDRNGDGDVSRREFLGTDEQFKEIDTDGDGLISVEEAEAYDKKLRERGQGK